MQITEIVLSRSRKVNLGNYESADVFMSMKIELETSDQEPARIDKLVRSGFRDLRKHVNDQADIIEGKPPK
jgi:hypothetical protein